VAVDSVHIEDVSVEETWARLKADPKAVLVDVRTSAEWTFVGVPDVSPLGKRLVAQEWLTYPDNRVDPQFTPALTARLQSAGVAPDDEIFFICRSGARSRAAAGAMARAGFGRCRNVQEGFEGPLNHEHHRASVGWKAAGLPWVQD
jgi:rhodanese-related sulfurtransferase